MPEYVMIEGDRFEVFERPRRGNYCRPNSPMVSIQASGLFRINREAFAMLGGASAVTLWFDAGTRRVGFVPADLTNPRAFLLRKLPGGLSYAVAGRAFCRSFGIETGRARRFAPRMEDGRLTIDLGDELSPPPETRPVPPS